jgi:DNA-binding transcriptional LysR family regulator
VDELRLIRQAIVLGRHGNFARAAEELNLSQPSVTRGIASLERSLGVRLFDRTRKGVIPTAFGRVLLERGEAVLRSEANLRREIELLAGLEEGSLAIGAGPYPAEISVATAVARVASAHPRLRIRCTTADPDQVVRDVLAERIDVGIAGVAGLEKDARLVVEPLPPLRVFLACRPGHPLAKETRLSLARAFEFPFVGTRLRGPQAAAAASRGAATDPGDPAVPDFVPQILVNSLAVARQFAQGSDALFPATAGILADDLAAGRLVTLDCDAPILRTTHGVLYLRDRTLAPAAREFIETLRAVEAEVRAADAPPSDAGPAPGGRRPAGRDRRRR